MRVRRTVAEKRRIVELMLEPGASVARVAQAEGVNTNQVFAWRRSYRAGKFGDGQAMFSVLLPVLVSHVEQTDEPQTADGGSLRRDPCRVSRPGIDQRRERRRRPIVANCSPRVYVLSGMPWLVSNFSKMELSPSLRGMRAFQPSSLIRDTSSSFRGVRSTIG